MTGRRTGRDPWASRPRHYAMVGLALLATVALVIGTAAGPRAGLTAAALVLGVACAGVVALIVICLAADHARTARHAHARRRAGLAHLDTQLIEEQALTRLGHHLDQEA